MRVILFYDPDMMFCAVNVTTKGPNVYVQGTLWVFTKQTSGSVTALLGVVQTPPFQLWLGNSTTIVAALREALEGLNLIINAPI